MGRRTETTITTGRGTSVVSTRETRIDMHVKVVDESVIQRAAARGIDALVYAPHFTPLPTIERRATELSSADVTVIPAREVFTGPWHQRRHVLAIGLTDPVPDFIPLATALAEFERQEAAILIPHPGFLSVSLSRTEVERHRDHIHAIECYNPKFLPHHTRRARRIARITGLPTFASSYAHLRGTVGDVWTTYPGEIDSAMALRDALSDGTVGVPVAAGGLRHASRRALEFGHLAWENSGTKAARVFSPGREPTHPHQAVYEGRFDEVTAD